MYCVCYSFLTKIYYFTIRCWQLDNFYKYLQKVVKTSCQKFPYWSLLVGVLLEPGGELLVPDGDQHLRPHHVRALVVHCLPLVIGPGPLPGVSVKDV